MIEESIHWFHNCSQLPINRTQNVVSLKELAAIAALKTKCFENNDLKVPSEVKVISFLGWFLILFPLGFCKTIMEERRRVSEEYYL
jgi:hypothetical protein